MATIKLIACFGYNPEIEVVTPFDGQYVVEYDPSRPGTDPQGNPMLCHLVTTPDRDKALDLSPDQAIALWRQDHGLRPDGKPNRPLTAFTVEIA